MSYLAEFNTAPSGSQYKVDVNSEWQTASVGTQLGDGYRTKNINNYNYKILLYLDACIFFETEIPVGVSAITGVVKYRDANQNWVTVTSDCEFSANAVCTGPNSGSVIVDGSPLGGIGPRPIS